MPPAGHGEFCTSSSDILALRYLDKVGNKHGTSYTGTGNRCFS